MWWAVSICMPWPLVSFPVIDSRIDEPVLYRGVAEINNRCQSHQEAHPLRGDRECHLTVMWPCTPLPVIVPERVGEL